MDEGAKQDIINQIVSEDTGEVFDFKKRQDKMLRKLFVDEIYEIEEIHWYYKYRLAILKKLLKSQLKIENPNILDIGVGTGRLSKYLEDFGNVTHIEKNISNIIFSKDVNKLTVLHGELPWMIPVEEHSMDYVVMLNLIEYIENDLWAMDNVSRKIKDDGKIIISTLLNKSIYGKSDKLYGILRRYNKSELIKMLNDAGLKVDYCTCFESSLGIKQSFKLIKDKLFEEEDLFLNYIPENNDEIWNSSRIDRETILNKPINYGNQIFLVCSKMTDEEKEEWFDKENKPDKKDSWVKKIFNKEK